MPAIAARLERLTGGAWELSDFVAVAAGSDVDLMTHLVEAVSAREPVSLYPADWWGFRVGCTHTHNIHWDASARGRLACLCIPSVRNGHLTSGMLDFLDEADAALLNINLFPTLDPESRHATASALAPILPKSILSISFSRGFGLTASQLGLALIHRDHPYLERFRTQLQWFTYFYNALAAEAFCELDLDALAATDAARREHVHAWLRERGLPVVTSGTYYVKSFRFTGTLPERFAPLVRGDDTLRLCMTGALRGA